MFLEKDQYGPVTQLIRMTSILGLDRPAITGQ